MVKTFKLTKYKSVEIKTYNNTSFGVVLSIRAKQNYPGARLEISCWRTLAIDFYDWRRWAEIEDRKLDGGGGWPPGL